jgi:glutamate--cysteine ligase catalytic subunit
MSKVTENYKRANTINAAVKQKFFFRTNLFETGHPIVEELTISEIFQGKGPFVGLLKIVDIFLTRSFDELIEESLYNKAKPGAQVQATFQFLADIAKGKVPTMATQIRRIINDHPLYNHDSLLSDALLDDLTSKLLDLQNNRDKSVYKIVNNYLRD